MRGKGIQKAVELGVTSFKKMMQGPKTPGQIRREEVINITRPQMRNPLQRMDDSAKQYFGRQNLK
tara:strand:+ start:192 stop:386 length:195 start_codon:yes stop_codon:yes gene_type:complete